MFSALGILVLIVLFLTIMWIAKLRNPPPTTAPEEEEEPEQSGTAIMIQGANYGLVLGIIACLVFKISPLMLVISLVGIYYAARALWQGLSWYKIIVYRALAGFLLSLTSITLHFLNATAQLPPSYSPSNPLDATPHTS